MKTLQGEEISTLSNKQLTNILLTVDGQGTVIKEAVLFEVVKRSRQEYIDMLKSQELNK